jgi:Predicted esterase of the alpha/beta hydrolase fold
MTPVTTLILPGLSNSGPEHWQSHWERADPTIRRVVQDDWETPRCADWVARLSEVMGDEENDVVLVAHSSSCALVAHWAAAATPAMLARVRGALLVAPSDPEGPNYPEGPSGFGPVPMKTLPFRSILVASDDDRYVTVARARAYAHAWGSEFVDVGSRGHINSTSGLGAWAEGRELLARLQGAPSPSAGQREMDAGSHSVHPNVTAAPR